MIQVAINAFIRNDIEQAKSQLHGLKDFFDASAIKAAKNPLHALGAGKKQEQRFKNCAQIAEKTLGLLQA